MRTSEKKGRKKGEFLNQPGVELRIGKRQQLRWVIFERWCPSPRESNRPFLVCTTRSGKEVRIDMLSGAVVSGLYGWYLDPADKQRLVHEESTGMLWVEQPIGSYLYRQKRKNTQPLFHVHKPEEQQVAIKRKVLEHGAGAHQKYGRPDKRVPLFEVGRDEGVEGSREEPVHPKPRWPQRPR
jgi:hypothetical protein